MSEWVYACKDPDNLYNLSEGIFISWPDYYNVIPTHTIRSKLIMSDKVNAQCSETMDKLLTRLKTLCDRNNCSQVRKRLLGLDTLKRVIQYIENLRYENKLLTSRIETCDKAYVRLFEKNEKLQARVDELLKLYKTTDGGYQVVIKRETNEILS